VSVPPDTKLHRPFEQWPLLLLGPMLRRVTEDSVSVFVALSARVEVTLKLFTEPGPEGEEFSRSVPSYARVVSVGKRLHVCVATAFGTIRPGVLYGYDLEFGPLDPGDPEDTGTSLGGLGLLSGPVPLGYENAWLPSFVLPPSRRDLKTVQASCRKPHGCHRDKRLTDADALPMVDRLIADNLEVPAQRPQQLFLTGDQIYSDDVPAAMLAALTSIGRELLSWSTPERFPDRRGGAGFLDDHELVTPGMRSIFLDDQAVKDRPSGTSDHDRKPLEIDEVLQDVDEPLEGGNWDDYAANHLLFLGEWCAMYVMAWSPELWLTRDAVDPQDRVVDPNLPTYYLPRPTDYWVHSPDTTSPALIYAEGLPFVRRALANIATYTAIDDHDVTDDWFLNAKIEELLRRGRLEDNQPSSGGRRLMRNALIAYALFQHWGNVPRDFDAGTLGGRLLDLLDIGPVVDEPGAHTPPIGQAGREDDADTLLDVGPEAVGVDRADERIRWDYELLFGEHRVLVLDTRTWRGFPDAIVDVAVTDLVAAGEQRVPPPAGWGTTELHGLAAAWASTAVTVANAGEPVLGDLLGAGAAALEHAAALAEAVHSGDAEWPQHAEGVVTDARSLLLALADAGAVQEFAWAVQAAGTAEAKLVAAWDGADPAPDVRVETLRASTSLEASAVVLQAAVPGVIGRFAVAGIESDFDAAAACLWRGGELIGTLATFLRWSAVSPGQAARAAGELAAAWLALGGDLVRTLFPSASPAALAAVDQAATASTTLRGVFADVEREWADHVDPVWDTLVASGTATLSAELISGDALQMQVVDRLAEESSQRELTIVVSPAPVFDHVLVFVLVRLAIATSPLNRQAASEWENEPWGGNLRAFHRLLEALAPLESAVILSGDVHYACSSVHDYDSPGGRRARFIQLTSSASKNSWEPSTLLARWDKDDWKLADYVAFAGELPLIFPTLESWADFGEFVEDLVPTRENAVELLDRIGMTVAQEAEELGDRLWEPSDLAVAIETVRRYRSDVVDRSKVLYHQVLEYRHQPWHIEELLYTFPLASQEVLLALHALGVDPTQLPRTRSTVLEDRRGAARINDSPGLDAAIADQASLRRDDILGGESRTVGRANIGLVRFDWIDFIGDIVVHELYSFPVDQLPHIRGVGPPPPETSFRDDWIITRHSAGLPLRTPHDVGEWEGE
jgi:hypothetical protein